MSEDKLRRELDAAWQVVSQTRRAIEYADARRYGGRYVPASVWREIRRAIKNYDAVVEEQRLPKP